MDKDLVEKITRLVIEKMSHTSQEPSTTIHALSESEIRDWETIHHQKGLAVSTPSREPAPYLTPLSTNEVEEWKGFDLMDSFEDNPTTSQVTPAYANNVRFTKYC